MTFKSFTTDKRPPKYAREVVVRALEPVAKEMELTKEEQEAVRKAVLSIRVEDTPRVKEAVERAWEKYKAKVAK